MNSEHLPKIFNEASAILHSFKIFCVIMAVVVPAFIFADHPDVRTYLIAYGIFSVIMPPSWCICYTKIAPALSSSFSASSRHGGRLLRRPRMDASMIVSRPNSGDNEKAAR
jgi:hypothetical protein